MTTSGVTTTQLNRDSIVKAAMRKIGALAQGQTPSTEDYTNGTEALNNLVAEFQTLGMPLWSKKELNITFIVNQKAYTIGVGQTINTAFPLKVLQAWTTLISGTGSRQQLEPRSVYDYNILPSDTTTTGSPSTYEYQPFINYGVLKVWPAPDATVAGLKQLTISYMAPFEDFVSSADTPYFPKEWNNALVYGLAALLAPEWGVPIQDRNMLRGEAKEHLETVLDFGMEEASMFFQPTENWNRTH
jgi:hypothetical protein